MDDKLFKKRHSYAHVLAQAVLQMFPEAKIAIGPVIDTGFYYDFELPRTLIPEDLEILEEKMKEIIKQRQDFEMYEEPVDKAIQFLKAADQKYKVEIVEDLVKNESIDKVSFYKNGEHFVDLCEGPHVDNTSKLDPTAFKLDKISAAYWRGDENRESLQRIYGLAFNNRKDLRAYLDLREEEAKRDHRKLGKELELYTIYDEVGAGLAMWLPNGTVIRDELEKLAKEWEFKADYKRVATPHIAKQDLFMTSGHLPYYEGDMFPAMEMDETKYYLKAMNCPHHHMLYKFKPHSYRELPLRFAEYGQVYRFEQSGELNGLMRVRGMCMNDAHIYVRPDQITEEFVRVINLHEEYYKLFGIQKVQYRLSKHSKEGLGKKYVENEQAWIDSEDKIRTAMQQTGIDFVEAEDEGAFYGPKIDIQIFSAIGKEYTVGTCQLDFAQPERFALKYIDKDGEEKMPFVIHRAPLSTHERFIGFLIEHFAGVFPTWLAPIQVVILPVSDVHNEYATRLQEKLHNTMVRVEQWDASQNSLGKRIREAELAKIPYMLVIGDKELESNGVAVRNYKTKEQKEMTQEEFIKDLLEEIETRAL